MYGFQDISKTNQSTITQPSEAIIWNGHNLDVLIPQYRTLNVEGRESYTRSVNSIDVPRDGSLFTNSFLDNRVIIVTFSLVAKNNAEFNAAFDKLKALLQGEEVPFQFADEMQYTRYGTVKALTNSNPGRLSVVGSFEIEMSQPFKYSAVNSLSTTNGVLSINGLTSSVPIKPESFTFTTVSMWPLFNFGVKYRIEFDVVYPAGSVITIDFKNNTVTRGGVNEYQHVALSSNIGDLRIENKMEIRSITSKEYTIRYREAVI